MKEKIVSVCWLSTPVRLIKGRTVAVNLPSSHRPEVTWAWTQRIVGEIC